MASLLYRRGRLAMIRLVADVIGHIPLRGYHLATDRQVGEVAPAPRLDVRIIWWRGTREQEGSPSVKIRDAHDRSG